MSMDDFLSAPELFFILFKIRPVWRQAVTAECVGRLGTLQKIIQSMDEGRLAGFWQANDQQLVIILFHFSNRPPRQTGRNRGLCKPGPEGGLENADIYTRTQPTLQTGLR